MNMFSVDNSLRGCFFSRSQSHINWLWHKRLSYLNFKSISKIANGQLLIRIPWMRFLKEKMCSTFEKGKQTKSSFRRNQCSSIMTPFSLLHMDLLCPIPIASLAVKKFSIVILDEFSRYTWVMFLRNKNDDA